MPRITEVEGKVFVAIVKATGMASWRAGALVAVCAVCALGSDVRDLVREEVGKAAVRHGVDRRLARAVAKVESGFHPGVVSSKGAVGVMQLMPATAMSLGVNPWDARQNIDGGVRYLSSLLGLYGGDVRKALAAYNAGPAAVERYGGVPPYKETRLYVKLVMGEYSGENGSENPTPGGRDPNAGPDPCAKSVAVLGLDGEWTSLDREPAPSCAN